MTEPIINTNPTTIPPNATVTTPPTIASSSTHRPVNGQSKSSSRPSTSGSGGGHHHQQQHKPGHHKSQTPNKPTQAANSATNTANQNDILNSSESDFNCRLKFQNTLPDIPFDPKLLLIPTDFEKYVEYKSTSLEKSYKYPLLTETHLGIPIELIDPTLYYLPKSKIPIPVEDQYLIRSLAQQDEEEKLQKSTKKIARPSVTWLRKTEYLSVTEENQLGKKSSPMASKQNQQSLQLYQGGQPFSESPSQIIENTFDTIKDFNFVHPTNPSLEAVKILPVFPDFELWSNKYTEVTFDADPFEMPPTTLKGDEFKGFLKNQQVARDHGIVKGTTGKFVYFISPQMISETLDNNNNNNGTSNKRYKLDTNEETGKFNYQMQRVFTSDVAVDKSNENFFLIVKDDAVYYNRVKTRLALKRVKSKADKTLVDTKIGKPEFVTYESRELNDKEKDDKETMMSNLLQEEKIPFGPNNSNKRKLDLIEN